jgi:hypothetical protein
MKPPIHISMNVLVTVLKILMFAPIGPKTSQPRFTRDATSKKGLLRFPADQWAGGLYAYSFFINGRRTGKLQLTSASRGPAKAMPEDSVVPRMDVLESKKIISEESTKGQKVSCL